jgi:predicted SAM-dependent methyltransferase
MERIASAAALDRLIRGAMITPPIIKLNLGCGPSGQPGWINVDWGILPLLSKIPWLRRGLIQLGLLAPGYDVPWPDIQLRDIRRPFPWEDGTVDFIYCSHVLEHVERWEALRILKESRRVLREGGRVRIVVPDLRLAQQIYQGGFSAQPESPQPATEFCHLLWGYRKDLMPASWFHRWSRSFIRGHQWAYDAASLRELFQEAGFRHVEFYAFGEGQVPDLQELDRTEHRDHSLYSEAY